MPFEIRRALAAEAGQLTRLAHTAKSHWGYPVSWIAAWEQELSLTPEFVAAEQVFVAEQKNVIVGVCALEDHGESWSLEHVWVDPEYHGQGIGAALVRHAIETAGRSRAGVITVTSDPHAAGFYERLGAKPIGDIPAPMPGDPKRSLPRFEFVVE